ncbi:MAG: hypothetical protein DRI84_10145 [Bacteroidetes bacterium]|nr:MAG: hypothetical protein DRI84_10145 [Bacteroidota bacterium]
MERKYEFNGKRYSKLLSEVDTYTIKGFLALVKRLDENLLGAPRDDEDNNINDQDVEDLTKWRDDMLTLTNDTEKVIERFGN